MLCTVKVDVQQTFDFVTIANPRNIKISNRIHIVPFVIVLPVEIGLIKFQQFVQFHIS